MIYKTFEQWKSGNVLEHGVPRTEYYSEDQLDLVEMGWSYGYDAGRAVEQALDKKAENARELGLDYEPVQEPVAWAHKEGLEKINDFDASIYARGGFDDAVPLYTTPPAKREWTGLTDEEIYKIDCLLITNITELVIAIEAKLKERNT
jgi:hypothetical protein